tara:strand:- start:324 stop:2339 length:2016 start_codon:yes stop_codon:yes gene_type:complete
MSFRVSADIGGTFTDIVVNDVSNDKISTFKVLTTPSNPADAVLDGLNQHIKKTSDINFLVHGTTVGLNSFLERKGARVLLVMTSGISDTYTVARGDRKELYNVQYKKPQQLVPRKDVMEVRERMQWDGKIIEEINKDDLIKVIKKINSENIDAIAICFLHSYVNPKHEQLAKEFIKKEVDSNVVISLSHEIAREWREYERASTAVMNSYIGPVTNNYLKSLESKLIDEGYKKPLYIMQSNGGVIRAKSAIEQPVKTLLSGPVGGTIGGVSLSKKMKKPNLICVDMGGTSFDMSLIVDGDPKVTNETEQQYLPLLIPLVDIHTIGAGGGSLAWLEAGALRVGPKSAGADPGPACYGKGGLEPTVTDANLFLGRIGDNSKLGGWMSLDKKASENVLNIMSSKLSISKSELAEGILSIINAKMADAIRTITVKQGIDPREFSLVAFGGAGSMHAVWLAEELEIKEIIVPISPGTFSAWGMLQTDIRRDLNINFFQPFQGLDQNLLINCYENLKKEATELLIEEEVEKNNMQFLLTADMRYIGQEYYVNVPIKETINIEQIGKDFHKVYDKQYGHSTPEGPSEFINLRLSAIGNIDKGTDKSKFETKDSNIEDKNREVIFNNKSYKTSIINRNNLKENTNYKGPLIIEEDSATTVIPPNYILKIDEFRNLLITKE